MKHLYMGRQINQALGSPKSCGIYLKHQESSSYQADHSLILYMITILLLTVMSVREKFIKNQYNKLNPQIKN